MKKLNPLFLVLISLLSSTAFSGDKEEDIWDQAYPITKNTVIGAFIVGGAFKIPTDFALDSLAKSALLKTDPGLVTFLKEKDAAVREAQRQINVLHYELSTAADTATKLNLEAELKIATKNLVEAESQMHAAASIFRSAMKERTRDLLVEHSAHVEEEVLGLSKRQRGVLKLTRFAYPAGNGSIVKGFIVAGIAIPVFGIHELIEKMNQPSSGDAFASLPKSAILAMPSETMLKLGAKKAGAEGIPVNSRKLEFEEQVLALQAAGDIASSTPKPIPIPALSGQ